MARSDNHGSGCGFFRGTQMVKTALSELGYRVWVRVRVSNVPGGVMGNIWMGLG